MRHVFTIFKREILKILTSWKKTVAIFIIPAIVMVCALNLFPQLIKYLTTGSVGRQKVVVYNAPESFLNFQGKSEDSYEYEYKENLIHFIYLSDEDESDILRAIDDGKIIVVFWVMSKEDPTSDKFDATIDDYYDNQLQGYSDYLSGAIVSVISDNTNVTLSDKAYQFRTDILENYAETVKQNRIEEDGNNANSYITIDSFNPITLVMDHRSNANYVAARIVPGIIVLLMYYCVYSLSADMLAMEKSRGFLAKLQMTPVPLKNILLGKILAIDLLVTVSAFCTLFFLFLSSWMNRSNDSSSLLPFGMLLLPNQLLYLLLTVPSTGFIMGAFCFKVIADIQKYKDTIENLQLPLVLLLIDFFIQMFMGGSSFGFEYLVPFHNLTAIVKDVFLSEVSMGRVLEVIIINTLLGILLLVSCNKKLGGAKK